MIRHEADFDLLVAGALLDDLDTTELARFEAHQAGCPRCAALTDDLSSTLADLALVAPARRPPAALGSTLLAAIQADRSAGSDERLAEPRPISAPAARDVTTTVGPPRPSWSDRFHALTAGGPGRVGWVVVAGLLVIALGLGAWGVSTRQELDRVAAETNRLRAMLTDQAAVMSVALAPDRQVAALAPEALAPSAEAMVVYRPGHDDAFVVARQLPATPVDHVYQLWVADAAGVHPLQTLSYDGQGPLIAEVGRDLAGSSALMITLEPLGGATGEPGPQVVFGKL